MYFFDTNALLDIDFSSINEKFAISSTTLIELEQIKTNRIKDESVRASARIVAHWLMDNPEKYDVIFYDNRIHSLVEKYGINPDIPDNQICGCAKFLSDSDSSTVFVTKDVNCLNIARWIFALNVKTLKEEADNYKGFKEVRMDDKQMAEFYQDLTVNRYSLLKNEYIIIHDSTGAVIDKLRWTGKDHEVIFKKNIKSMYFDKLKAKDDYQACAIDSLVNNTITAISGKAGSGKSLLSLMVAMYLIEVGKYDRLVVLYNPTKVRGAADMGFYSGDAFEKGMQNFIGQVLTTKFGDRYAIDMLIQQNKLKLVSMADIRGMEIMDNEILWITEGQNTSIDLIKLCLSRVSSGAKVFLEGDYTSQVDSKLFDGKNNGLHRVIKAFKGHDEFGYVQLQNVWRSKIAELCELL